MSTQRSNTTGILKSNLVIAYRNIVRKAGYSAINVLGLAIGLACCLLISIYVQHELSYDNFQNPDTYRIGLNRIYPDRQTGYAIIPPSIGPQLEVDYPEVVKQARVLPPFGTVVFRYEDKFFNESFFLLADSSVFDVLSIPLIEGDPKNALKDKNTIVITESTAKKYFGDDDPIGKTLETAQNNYLVTAVARDYPENSHFKFDLLASIHTLDFINRPIWAQFSALTYLKLEEGSDPNLLEQKIPAFVKTYAAGQIEARTGMSFDEYIAAGNGYHYYLQNVGDIHLNSHLENEIKVNGNATYLLLFILIAAFILVIACINFMNLSTARSIERAKEVGVRKVMGSLRAQLVVQFLTESLMITIISLIIALFIVYMSLPALVNLSERALTFSTLLSPGYVGGVLLGVLVIGTLAGLYPALVLSAFKPVNVLKGKLKSSRSGTALRNGLVVFQFMVSVMLISFTTIIYDQMQFMINKNLGFNQDEVIIIRNADNLADSTDPFKNAITNHNEISHAAMTSAMPGDFYPGFSFKLPGQHEEFVARQVAVDDDFIETMQVKLVEGRSFSREFTDSLNIIVNSALVDELNLSDPIGMELIDTGATEEEQVRYPIIGVIEDYHFQSLRTKIDPQVLLHTSNSNTFPNLMAVKLAGGNLNDALSELENHWNRLAPSTPFEYYFLDTYLQQFYNSERTSGKLFTIFTALAIFIACIGLLGLSSYTINQKTKEIGVRKVMGANIFQIILLLSKDFTKLVIIAIVLAIPISYFYMDYWLNDFAYRIRIEALTFIVAGISAMLIAWITIGYQSFRAASTNPVSTLRYE